MVHLEVPAASTVATSTAPATIVFPIEQIFVVTVLAFGAVYEVLLRVVNWSPIVLPGHISFQS